MLWLVSMGYRRTPFAINEWYHCFDRGIDKRTTFETGDDCNRFVELMYLSNDTKPIVRGNFQHMPHHDILQLPREQNIVAIGGYSLMPNHYHILMQEIEDRGISKFMQKLGTGYAMYFNEKRSRVGNIFVKPFRSKHVDDETYLRHVLQYIHLNVAEKFEPNWKHGKVSDFKNLEHKLLNYPFSSMPDYCGLERVERAILDDNVYNILADGLPKLSSVLRDAATYYTETESSF